MNHSYSTVCHSPISILVSGNNILSFGSNGSYGLGSGNNSPLGYTKEIRFGSKVEVGAYVPI